MFKAIMLSLLLSVCFSGVGTAFPNKRDALSQAIIKGEIAKVKKYLKEGMDPNSLDTSGLSAFATVAGSVYVTYPSPSKVVVDHSKYKQLYQLVMSYGADPYQYINCKDKTLFKCERAPAYMSPFLINDLSTTDHSYVEDNLKYLRSIGIDLTRDSTIHLNILLWARVHASPEFFESLINNWNKDSYPISKLGSQLYSGLIYDKYGDSVDIFKRKWKFLREKGIKISSPIEGYSIHPWDLYIGEYVYSDRAFFSDPQIEKMILEDSIKDDPNFLNQTYEDKYTSVLANLLKSHCPRISGRSSDTAKRIFIASKSNKGNKKPAEAYDKILKMMKQQEIDPQYQSNDGLSNMDYAFNLCPYEVVEVLHQKGHILNRDVLKKFETLKQEILSSYYEFSVANGDINNLLFAFQSFSKEKVLDAPNLTDLNLDFRARWEVYTKERGFYVPQVMPRYMQDFGIKNEGEIITNLKIKYKVKNYERTERVIPITKPGELTINLNPTNYMIYIDVSKNQSLPAQGSYFEGIRKYHYRFVENKKGFLDVYSSLTTIYSENRFNEKFVGRAPIGKSKIRIYEFNRNKFTESSLIKNVKIEIKSPAWKQSIDTNYYKVGDSKNFRHAYQETVEISEVEVTGKIASQILTTRNTDKTKLIVNLDKEKVERGPVGALLWRFTKATDSERQTILQDIVDNEIIDIAPFLMGLALRPVGKISDETVIDILISAYRLYTMTDTPQFSLEKMLRTFKSKGSHTVDFHFSVLNAALYGIEIDQTVEKITKSSLKIERYSALRWAYPISISEISENFSLMDQKILEKIDSGKMTGIGPSQLVELRKRFL